MIDSISDGRVLPDEPLRVAGPHCPRCGGTRWVDPAFSECASCRWLATDPVPMPEPMRPELSSSPVEVARGQPASRLERLLFALIEASPTSHSWNESGRASLVADEALYLENFLRKQENAHD